MTVRWGISGRLSRAIAVLVDDRHGNVGDHHVRLAEHAALEPDQVALAHHVGEEALAHHLGHHQGHEVVVAALDRPDVVADLMQQVATAAERTRAGASPANALHRSGRSVPAGDDAVQVARAERTDVPERLGRGRVEIAHQQDDVVRARRRRPVRPRAGAARATVA